MGTGRRFYAVDSLNHMERNGMTVVTVFTIPDNVNKFCILNVCSIADWSMQTKDVKSEP